jgi:hypothetical protein
METDLEVDKEKKIWRWTQHQIALRAWLRERNALPGHRTSVILDRKYKQQNALGFAGVSTLLASYVVSELSESGILVGLTRDNRHFMDKVVEMCPSALTPMRELNVLQFKPSNSDSQRAWYSANLRDLANVRHAGRVEVILSDSLSCSTLMLAIYWIQFHSGLFALSDVHLIWVVKTRTEDEDDIVRRLIAHLLMPYEIYELEK